MERESSHQYVVDDAQAGNRLDAVLSILVPALGLRARRRLIESGDVRVNGRPCKAGRTVCRGDTITLQESRPEETDEGKNRLPVIAGRAGRYTFLLKPAGLHSVHLAGGHGKSVEDMLPTLLDPGSNPHPVLLQRLDCSTSGIVTVADDEQSAAAFRDAEKNGQVHKRYVCLLDGVLSSPVTVASQLVSDGHNKVRALARDDADPTRRTHIVPLLPVERDGRAYTLAGCEIMRGFRHQIRAHAAGIGHPLSGDALYGGGPLPVRFEHVLFLLHHGCISFPGAGWAAMPEWQLRPESECAVHDWLFEGRPPADLS